MSAQIKVGGRWLGPDVRAAFGELEYSTGADGGCLQASWKMDLPRRVTRPLLRRNQLVEIKDGPQNIFAGILTEPDADDAWTLTAMGLGSLGHGDFLAFDASLGTTTTPDVAIDQAIARGLPWKRPVSLSNVPFAGTNATDSINYVGDLLDAWATSAGKRWGVNADREVYAVVDPTVPTWHLTPGSGRFGMADDDYASDLYGRYLTAGAGYATAHVGDAPAAGYLGVREAPVDLTPLGIITLAKAQTILNGMLAKGKSRMGYTNGLEVTKYQLTTPGGTPAHLPFVTGGQLVRMHGQPNEQGVPLSYVDFVIGETHLQAGAKSITISPTGLAARDLTSVLSLTGSAA